MNRTGHMFLFLVVCALLAFTVYVLLDTFVIVRRWEPAAAGTAAESAQEIRPVQTAAEQEENSAEPAAEETAAVSLAAALQEETGEPVITTDSYTDGNISVTLTEYRICDTTVYVADVQLSSADYLQTALAENTYGRNVTDKTSDMAEAVSAVLAVNGDYYGARQTGYVIRSGVLYRSTADKGAEDLVIYADGSFGIVNESEITAEQLLADGAWNVLSFGPALVEDGEIAVTPGEEVGRAKASNPRTAIAVIDELHYLFVVSDGRTSASEGLSLFELAAFLKELGAETAYNLDGGGSSTMVFNGLIVNNPTGSGKGSGERSVSDIVYIGQITA